jgi:hypothetical protein
MSKAAAHAMETATAEMADTYDADLSQSRRGLPRENASPLPDRER